ncbi:MAG: glycoside hydrolase family 31 protein [Solirubrobacterales bacterium]|nr:glycoside hydrolase family 31 protein [Solirubrobacterales bacterium]
MGRGMKLLVVSLAAIGAMALSGGAQASGVAGPTEKVQSKPIRVVVGTKRWSFAVRNLRGRAVLGGVGGQGGSLAFRVGEKWFHPTRALNVRRQGVARILRLDTTDPDRDLSVKLTPARGGSIQLVATVVGTATGIESIAMNFRAPDSERYLGFGERSNAVDQRGGVVENWVGEGPYQPTENAAIKAAVPPWAVRTNADATYFPMPWLLSTAGYGVLVENPEPSYFRLGSDRKNVWSVEVRREIPDLERFPADAPSPRSLSLRFFGGPRPADVLRRLTARLGRQPAAAPFAFGPWVQPKGDEATTISTLEVADSPTSVGQTYLHYLPCMDQIGHEQEQVDRTEMFHQNGMAVTTYLNPMICTSLSQFAQLESTGQLTEARDGSAYTYNYLRYHVGQFDFTSKAAQDSYGAILREALSHGYDGWMEDFGEYTPPDSVSSDGTPGMLEHNPYVRQYHCAADRQTRGHSRPVLRFTRSGWTGTAACTPVVWGGDPSTTWDYDGLRASVRNGLTMGLSGVGVWGSDIGGFFSLFSDPLSPELLTRWVQFGAFSGVMRSQADGFQVDGRARPQILDPDQIDNWRRYSKLRTQLYPYVRAAATDYRRTGLPMMRAMVLQYPGDRRAVARDDQYMFGPDLLVAPVLEPGQVSRRVYLPKGRWIDLWRTLRYEPETGGFEMGRAVTRGGGSWRTVPAPLDEIPVLARAGAMLTTLEPDVDTLAPFGAGNSAVVRLQDRPARRLLAFPRGTSRGRFEGRGRLLSVEGRRSWALRVQDTRAREWRIEASLGSLKTPFAPRCVRLDGRPLPAGRWSQAGGVLKVHLRPRSRAFVLEAFARRCGRSG